MKKEYTTPEIKTEKVEMGVFGCYGFSSGGGNQYGGFSGFWKWFRKWFYNH